MRAIVIGATGATGHDLMHLLVHDATFTEVLVFGRRSWPGEKTNKIKEYCIDFDAFETWQDWVLGDVLFLCLGTTLKAAGSKEKQWRVDYDYQYKFAEIAKQNGVKTVVLVSAEMANANSSFFYMKMKGALENAVKLLGFEQTIIFNPPGLVRKESDRNGEVFGIKLLGFFNKMGLFTSKAPLKTEGLAKSMLCAVKTLPLGTHHVVGKDILKLISDTK